MNMVDPSSTDDLDRRSPRDRDRESPGAGGPSLPVFGRGYLGTTDAAAVAEIGAEVMGVEAGSRSALSI